MPRLLLPLVALTLSYVHATEKCPPIVGEAECPMFHFCKDKGCYASELQTEPATFCHNVVCRDGTACRSGMCFPVESLKCNRHVLVGDNEAHSVMTSCGRKARCVNGQCMADRCMGVWCPDGQMCSDGRCVQVAGNLCFGHADCGPRMECVSGACTIVAATPACNCSPTELCRQGYCLPNPRCATVRCQPGFFCLQGECVPAVGQSCGDDVCHGGTVCVNGVCQIDQCLGGGKCPENHSCRHGECRLLDGMPCIGECPSPYACIDGRCFKNNCANKHCPLGHTCEHGNCVKISDRFCFSAQRDCAYGYACEANKCVEMLTAEMWSKVTGAAL